MVKIKKCGDLFVIAKDREKYVFGKEFVQRVLDHWDEVYSIDYSFWIDIHGKVLLLSPGEYAEIRNRLKEMVEKENVVRDLAFPFLCKSLILLTSFPSQS